MLTCYTDGVTESFDQYNEQYGTKRLVSTLQHNRHLHTGAIIEAIADDVASFSDGRIYDDVTMVLIKRLTPPFSTT